MKSNKGLTMVELVVIITVMMVAVPGLMFFFFNWKGGLSEARLRSLATRMSCDLMDEIASKVWDENRTVGPVTDSQKTAAASLGPEPGESRYVSGANVFDDIDDYDSLSENPPMDSQGNALSDYSAFTRTVEVTYVADTDLDAAVVSSPAPDYKRVVVRVSWDGGTNFVEIINIFSNR